MNDQVRASELSRNPNLFFSGQGIQGPKDRRSKVDRSINT